MWRGCFPSSEALALALLATLGACSSRALPRDTVEPAPSVPRPRSAAGPASAAHAAAAPAASGTDDAGAPSLAPLVGDPLVALAVAGHEPAIVSVPLGATQPRPVLVATHGNYDRADWTCGIWRDIVQDQGFVLCPSGAARGDSPSRTDLRYHYLTNQRLEVELEAALTALRESYPEHLAASPHAFAGFSQGAIMGVAILVRRPELFDRAVLIEGGFDRWSRQGVEAFATGGGKRVAYVCGQWACEHGARGARAWFESAGLALWLEHAKGAGHTYGGPIAELTATAWSWVIEGDERWR